jgi:restriction system protein
VSKKQDSVAEELLKGFYDGPLWVAPIGVAIIYVVGAVILPALLANSALSRAFIPMLRPVTYLFCAAALGAAVLGACVRAVQKARDGATFDRQSGIESIRSLSWQQFERLMGEAYRRLGYEVRMTSRGADGGVDLILLRDGDTTHVQCKRWKTKVVGVELVRQLKGAMATAGVTSGVFVSSGRFTTDAARFAGQAGISLVDGPKLARLVSGLKARPGPVAAASEATHPGCPKCGGPMVRRTAKRGQFSGTDFLGCNQYPICTGTRSLGWNG